MTSAASNLEVVLEHHHGAGDSGAKKERRIPNDGLSLGDFVHQSRHPDNGGTRATVPKENLEPRGTFYIKTYGCQMNVNDSDIVRAVLLEKGYHEATIDNTRSIESTVKNAKNKKKTKAITPESVADIILTNTCAIREKAEEKVWQRLYHLRKNKGSHQIVGVLGCMAERLQNKLLEENVADLVVGPDAYRDLPKLLRQIMKTPETNKITNNSHSNINSGSDIQSTGQRLELTQEDYNKDPFELQEIEWKEQRKDEKKNVRPKAINVDLSSIETYDDILPVRGEEVSNPFSAFVSIQRGCSNRCSFCIVPFTRGGKERSRPFQSIVDEVKYMVEEQNLKEVVSFSKKLCHFLF